MIAWMQEGERLVEALRWLQDRATEREVAIACEFPDGGAGVVAMGGFRTTAKQSRSELWEVGVGLDRPSVVWEYPEIDQELDWRSIRWDLATHTAAIEIAMTFARDLIAERMGLSSGPIGRDGRRLCWPE